MEPEHQYLHVFDYQALLFLFAGVSGGGQFNGHDGYLMEEEPYFDPLQAGVYYTVEFNPYLAQPIINRESNE